MIHDARCRDTFPLTTFIHTHSFCRRAGHELAHRVREENPFPMLRLHPQRENGLHTCVIISLFFLATLLLPAADICLGLSSLVLKRRKIPHSFHTLGAVRGT